MIEIKKKTKPRHANLSKKDDKDAAKAQMKKDHRQNVKCKRRDTLIL